MRTRWSSKIALCVAPIFLALGCDESGPRVYTAQPYSDEGGCVGDYVPVGLVYGGDLASTCDPVCFTLAGQLYVSTVCQPLPNDAVVAADASDCPAALDAVDAGTFCGQMAASGDDGAMAESAGDDESAIFDASDTAPDTQPPSTLEASTRSGSAVDSGSTGDASTVDLGADAAISDAMTSDVARSLDAGRKAM